MNYGYQNEIDFVEFFNDKYFNEFDQNGKKFLIDLFGNIFDNTKKLKHGRTKWFKKRICL